MARSQPDFLGLPESRRGMLAEGDDIANSDLWTRDLTDVAEKPFASDLTNQRLEDRSNLSSTFTLSNLKSDSAKLAARTNAIRRDVLANATRRSATMQLSNAKSNVGARGSAALRGTQPGNERRSDSKQSAHQLNHVRSDIHSELRQAAPIPQRRVDTPTLIGDTVDQYATAATSTVKAAPRAGGARKLVAEKPDESDVPSITRYIQRFREAPPTSRAQRERSIRGTDFWWTDAHERDRENDVSHKDDRNKLTELDRNYLDTPKRDELVSTKDADTKVKDKENDVSRSGDYLDTQSEALSEATRSNVPAVSEDGVSSKPGESVSTESDLRSRAERYFTNERAARPSAFSTTNYHSLSSRALTDSDTKKPVTTSLIGQYASALHVVSTPVSPANRLADGEMDILQRWRLRRRLESARSEVLASATATGPQGTASASSFSTARRMLDFANAPTDLTRPKRSETLSLASAKKADAEGTVTQVRKQDKQCETEHCDVKPTRNEEAQTEVATCRSVETQVQHDDDLRLPLEFCMASEPNTFRSVLDSATPRSAPASAKVTDESATEQPVPSVEPESGTARRVTETIAETVTDLLFGRQPVAETTPINTPTLTPTQPKPTADSVPQTPTPDAQLALQPVAQHLPDSSTRNALESQTAPPAQLEVRDSTEVAQGNNTLAQPSATVHELDDDNETMRAAFEADSILQYLLERRRKLIARLEALELSSRSAE